MIRTFEIIAKNAKTFIAALVIAAAIGYNVWRDLAVDVFPDVSVPRVTIMTEAGGLTAEEVEQLVTIPIESEMNGIPGVSKIRSSSSGGLSFVWVDFDWDVDVSRARFDVFDRLSRVQETLPDEAHTEIAPVVSVTGEIMLVALTAKTGGATALEMREMAEYDLRTRLMAVPGIGEVAVIGGRLPEFRIAVNPLRLATFGLTVSDVIEASRDTRTFLSGGYLADVTGDEVPLRQVARADTLESLRKSPLPLDNGGSLKLGDIADITLSGQPRRGSASFNGEDAVVLSVQKVPGGNTPVLTEELEKVLADFAKSVERRGIEVQTDAYRQADFIAASIRGGGEVVRDAVIVVVVILLVTLLELRTLIVVLCTLPLSILLGVALFPLFGLGVNVMTLGGFAVAAGDIVDAAIIFTEVIRRKLGENSLLEVGERKSIPKVIASAAASVAPGVLFSTMIVALVFLPLLMLDGLEGKFFRPLALSYICIFVMSLIAAWLAVPSLARLFKLGSGVVATKRALSPGIRAMQILYRPFLTLATRLPKTILFVALAGFAAAVYVATSFGSSFLPPFREDSFNVMVSLPPGASLSETERVSQSCVPLIRSIPGVLSVTRRTGRAERDQHAEPVSSSEFVVRVDLKGDTDAVRDTIRDRLGSIPGVSLVVGYPIAHRISAVLSGTEAELAINVYGEKTEILREAAAEMKKKLEAMTEVADVRANREVMVRTLRVEYNMDSLLEAGITPREAGEQLSVAFNGCEVGEVREGIRRRAVTVRLAGDENEYNENTVRSLVLSGKFGKRVTLGDVAEVYYEEAPNLLLREGGLRKALISCNPAPGVDVGTLVEKMRRELEPIAAKFGLSVSFGGSYEASESAKRHLAFLSVILLGAIFLILLFALRAIRFVFLALLNVPLALIGSVVAVKLSDSVLSVSSLVGFVTVIGFTLRNGILLLNSYRERVNKGVNLKDAVREGSMERMAPIVLTSLTTIIALIPIILAANTPGGELLAPLGVVQFGGLLGATILNLIVLPAATLAFGMKKLPIAAFLALFLIGCKNYQSAPIDWQKELESSVTNKVTISSVEDARILSLVGNRQLNMLRLKAANSSAVAKEYGWWEDPEFDFDLMRIVDSSAHPVLGGASVAFTVPLSGALEREKSAAKLYAEADAARIIAKEKEISASACKSAIRLAMLIERQKILKEFDNDLKIVRSRENVEKLHKAGEISSSQLAGVRRAIHSYRHLLMDVERELALEKTNFLNLCGLLPTAELEVSFKIKAIKQDDLLIEPLAFVKHPEVKVALLNLGASEKQLEAEIRKQYPDLKLGPAYSNEEGLDRIGLVAGITLPLWNRNRKSISETTAARDEARLAAIDAWRQMLAGYAVASQTLKHLNKHPQIPPSELNEVDKLAQAGELTDLDYLTIRGEILEQKLNEASWRADLAMANAELEYYK